VLCERRWGSKRGLLSHVAWHAADTVGGLRRFRSVKWSRIERLVFVCKGNICRSPYAEARARALGLRVTSFGIDADCDKLASEEAALAAQARGVDLSRARARRVADVVLTAEDLLLAMEPWHARALEPLAQARGCQVTLLGLWARPRCPYIGDPHGRSEAFFARCFGAIDSGIDGVRGRLAAAPRAC
jgi:protein-tyrosine phosphatase